MDVVFALIILFAQNGQFAVEITSAPYLTLDACHDAAQLWAEGHPAIAATGVTIGCIEIPTPPGNSKA